MSDQRLIEAGFPCHQVGAETQRERGASSALPPLYYLHVWWARRPLTPSRAAILASLLPADADPDTFIKSLGIRRYQAVIDGQRWNLVTDTLLKRLEKHDDSWSLPVDKYVIGAFSREKKRREACRKAIEQIEQAAPHLADDPVLQGWNTDSEPLIREEFGDDEILEVIESAADPALVTERIEFAKLDEVKKALGNAIRWDKEDLYGYDRAFTNPTRPVSESERKVILDPTAGGGSIPFEALRLGHQVIANELNPVASVILKATLDFPFRFGKELIEDIAHYGGALKEAVESDMEPFTSFGPLPDDQIAVLRHSLRSAPELIDDYAHEHDQTGLLYCRQVTCPHCGGDAPMLNSYWLAKEGEKVAIQIVTRPKKTVEFRPHGIVRTERRNGLIYSYGPDGQEIVDHPTKGTQTRTVTGGVGQCVHCHQAISGDEIKSQARGESEHGRWKDVLYCVVGVRLEPKLDKHGKVQRYATGPRKGEVKTQKVRYFRPPNEQDLKARAAAEAELERRRMDFEMKGLVPNEPFPEGNDMRPVTYGMPTWADLFTPRQLLGHLTAMEQLQALKPQILGELGEEKGRAVITYLQFAIDKVVDYNCKQTRWHFSRGVLIGTFGRHDFSLKWTFGEMVFSGPSSGFSWGLSQVLDAYAGIAELARPRAELGLADDDLLIRQGSATNLEGVADASVDAIVMDPPYYDNVQYSELSDFYYVWQKRSLGDLYPGWFDEPVTDKNDEAVANPARDGSSKSAYQRYLELMQGIFSECRRVLKDDGIMTVMFTHKKQEAWETLTESLIRNGWNITGTYPVDSESGHSTHQMNMAAAASTIFLACRPGERDERTPSSWSYEVKGKLEKAVRDGLMEFETLKLGPVDRMIAAWGRALRVYSAHWPVLDGEEEIPPTRAMQEAARVVAEEEVRRLSGGRVTVDDLDDESRVALIALGINGLGEFAYDDALQLSRSLNFRLQQRNGNYRIAEGVVVYANQSEGQLAAPLVKKGSKLRLLKPEQRLRERLDNPQTLWDILCGLIVTYRDGGVVAGRNYVSKHQHAESSALRGLLKVWANECRDEDLQKEARLIDYEL